MNLALHTHQQLQARTRRVVRLSEGGRAKHIRREMTHITLTTAFSGKKVAAIRLEQELCGKSILDQSPKLRPFRHPVEVLRADALCRRWHFCFGVC